MLIQSPPRRRRALSQGQQLGILGVVLVVLIAVLTVAATRPDQHHYSTHVPNVGVTTTVNGNRAPPGGRSISLATGREITIMAHLEVPPGVTVHDLFLQAGPHAQDSPLAADTTVLAQVIGPLPNNHTISANWVIPAGPAWQIMALKFDLDFTNRGSSASAVEARSLFTFTVPR